MVDDRGPEGEELAAPVPVTVAGTDPVSMAPREVPQVDEFGILRLGNRWVALSESEWEVLTVLLDRFGKAVSTSDLRAAGGGDQPLTPAALNVRLTRLRQRIAPLGIRIINVRRRGYILDRVQVVEAAHGVYRSE